MSIANETSELKTKANVCDAAGGGVRRGELTDEILFIREINNLIERHFELPLG
ncbi:MAG: hypothetical protein ACREBC_38460 [Pyrinomonadaceae bacterium]